MTEERQDEPDSRRGRGLLAGSWLYAGLVLVTLGMIRVVGDGWWVVDVLLLMPRWIFLGPVALLAAASGWRRCFGHWALQAAIALVVAGPLMNFSAPLSQLWTRPPADRERLRVVTFNTAAIPFRDSAFRDWLDRERIDVVCFQEVRETQPKVRAAFGAGWHFSRGTTIATRYEIVAEMPKFEETFGGGELWTGFLELVRVSNAGGDGIPRRFAALADNSLRPSATQRRQNRRRPPTLVVVATGTRALLGAVAGAGNLPLVLAGDFNLPADDSTMVALRDHFRFAYAEAGWGYGYTKPSNLPWVRIDHILMGPEWSATWCRVGPDFGSDHLPLVAELALIGTGTAHTHPPPPAAAPAITVADPAGSG